MITLKIGKAICPVSNSVSPVSGKLTTLGLFFVEKKRLNETGNWIVFFFKEKMTLKHLKIIRSSEPRVRL